MRNEYDGYTPGWRIFDIAFGILAPIFIIVADAGFYRGRLIPEDWVFWILGLQAACFAAFLMKRRQAGRASTAFGLIFLLAFACSAAIALSVMRPSLALMMFFFGWYGLLPWFSAVAYLRNARFAFEIALDLRTYGRAANDRSATGS